MRYLKNVQAISDHLPLANLTQPGETFEYQRVVSRGNGSGTGIYERASASCISSVTPSCGLFRSYSPTVRYQFSGRLQLASLTHDTSHQRVSSPEPQAAAKEKQAAAPTRQYIL